MKEIDYSVPNKEKDVTPQFKVGDYVEGDCLYLERGQIESIKMSTGARKGLIYKIGLSWYFYNFIKPWYDGMIAAKIGKDKVYRPERTIKFKHNGIEYTITGILFHSFLKWCYLLVDKKEGTWQVDDTGTMGIGFHSLRPKQIERIYNLAFGNQ